MTLLDEAQRFISQGISITPVQGKIPYLDDWVNLDCEQISTDVWRHASGFGLICGKTSGIICLDIDRTMNGKADPIYEKILSFLPPILSGKIGNPNRPPARFFRYSGERSRKFIHIGVEILSDGNQTVLPPAKHPEFDYYKWEGRGLLDINIDDLPELPKDFIEFLERENDTAKAAKGIEPGKGRCAHGSHNQLSKMLVAKIHEGVKPDVIVDELLRYDRIINAKSDYVYFECPSRKEWRGCKDVRKNAAKFVAQGIKNHIAEVKTDDIATSKKGEQLHYKNYKPFFDKFLPGALVDLIGGEPITNEGKSVYNEIDYLKSQAVDMGLSDAKVVQHLSRYIKSELPEKLFIDIADWDGVDRVADIFSYLTFNNLESNEACELFNEWASRIFSRIYNPDEQNRFLILKGNQGKGKDTLIKNLLGGFKHYFDEMTIHRNAVENYQVMSRCAVLNVAEFDQTAKFEVSFLKDMVTKSGAVYRSPYARAPERQKFRCSFISTVNVDDILRDHTGNRRYQIFDIDSIDWSYPKHDRSQLVAQYHAMYLDGYRASIETWNKMKDYIGEMTPDDPDDLIVEEYEKMVSLDMTLVQMESFPYHRVSEIVAKIANIYRQTPRQIQRLLKRRGLSKKIGGVVLCFKTSIKN